jgi:alkanesulfonate monooxygenase SsuD/methylene tetrahydromethanopterin reductase-like flavin-dependent oxidoreductase (luciferase family)
MEEAIRLILKMWTEPCTTFHGRYFHVEEAILEPKPPGVPHPIARVLEAMTDQPHGVVERRVREWP